jgi:hypothetical protein
MEDRGAPRFTAAAPNILAGTRYPPGRGVQPEMKPVLNKRAKFLRFVRRAACIEWPLVPVAWLDQVYRAARAGYWPNYRNPRTLHEKLLTVLTEYPDPRLTQLSDKLRAKVYAQARVPELRVAEVFQVEADPARLRFDTLPPVAVMKTNHSSGTVRVIRAPYDRAALVQLASEWLKREWPGCKRRIEHHYAGIEPRLFLEAFLGDDPHAVVPEYRFMAFHGRVEYIYHQARFPDGSLEKFVLDRAWQPRPMLRLDAIGLPPFIANPSKLPAPPAHFERMLAAAEILADDFPFVRVDLFSVHGEIYFGELTFAPLNTFFKYPYATDLQVGTLIDLEQVRRLWAARSASTAPRGSAR